MNENGSQRVYELEQVLKNQKESRTANRGPMWEPEGANVGANKRANGEPTRRSTGETTERMTTGWTAG